MRACACAQRSYSRSIAHLRVGADVNGQNHFVEGAFQELFPGLGLADGGHFREAHVLAFLSVGDVPRQVGLDGPRVQTHRRPFDPRLYFDDEKWRRKEGTAVEQKRVQKWSGNGIKKTLEVR